jgi:DNA-binding HxlR family transcriptional regulator
LPAQGSIASHGIIDREVHQHIPPKVEYSLSAMGRRLKPVLLAMHDLGVELDCVSQRRRD